MKYSLCIPTINRYDTFLKPHLTEYIKNPLIGEIVISDEDGNDYEKICRDFKDHVEAGRIRVWKNETVLGPFLNKMKVCRAAKCKWIALIDSDNYANEGYFRTADAYITNNNIHKKTIIMPCFAKPNFDYRSLAGQIIKRNNIAQHKNKKPFILLFNTGNFIIHRHLIKNIKLDADMDLIKFSHACDVTLFNTLLFEQMDIEMHIVKDLHYDHAFHNNSIYLQTHAKYQKQIQETNNRFKRL